MPDNQLEKDLLVINWLVKVVGIKLIALLYGMITTKTIVIECKVCLNGEHTDTCEGCQGSGIQEVEVDMTPEEIEMEHECRMSEGGLSKWL